MVDLCCDSKSPVILVVDDEPHIRHALQRVLEQAGFSVHTAANGDHALQVVEKHSPAIVVLDVIMPGMNGREVAARIRANSTARIVYFTARADLAQVDNIPALEQEADALLIKPASSQRIISLIGSLLGLPPAK